MSKRLFATVAFTFLLGTTTYANAEVKPVETTCPFGDCDAAISFSYLGEVIIPTGTMENGLEFGGISGLDFDPSSGRYIAISDDRSDKGPARFYELDIDVSANGLKSVKVVKRVTLLDADGEAFPKNAVDPEAIRVGKEGIYWSSEGGGDPLIAPSVHVAASDGKSIRELWLPGEFAPTANKTSGVRENLSFENLAVAPSGAVFVAVEAALYQDGDKPGLTNGSLARIISYDSATGEPGKQYVYPVSPIPQAASKADGANDNGMSDMLALDDRHMLVVERNFAQGFGNNIKLFMVDLEGATDVSNIASLARTGERVVPARKSQVLDLRAIGLTPDNIEAISLGKAKDGTDVLILAADNNFSDRQKTQFYAFKIGGRWTAPGSAR
ncbi:esterase-like activity of phytase family protein [Agrobacterium sp. fls2-241-TYG-188a]|uniref:esterase-like activity of phytase family protein n=1 Tax=Agrobacterium sp. fls2-241-TYG-188a TaxID=3040275 RepID=UPI0025517645|nr:esterase-like activity of phytase family protein [Agrobacterium sp. fls2-241-TYG-188a]